MANVLTIAGVERPLRLTSLDYQSSINSSDVLNCRVVSEDGSYRPSLAQAVKLTEDSLDMFGGLIDVIEETGVDQQPGEPIESEITCVSYATIADWIHITETFPAGTTMASIAGTLVTNYLGPNYSVTLDGGQVTGDTLDVALEANEELLASFLQRLATITGYAAKWSPTKTFQLYAPGDDAAPFDVVDGDGNHVGDIRVTRSREKYYNRIYVRYGGDRVVMHTDPFTGDGSTDTFPLTYAIQGPFPNLPDGAAGYGVVDLLTPSAGTESLAGLTAPSGFIWEYDPSGPSITRRLGAPANGSTFQVRYDVQFPQVVMVEDAGEIAANGLRELRVELPDVFNKAEAQAAADALLAQHLATITKAEYLTRLGGIAPGMSQTITAADRNVNGTFLIIDVRATTRADSQEIWRVVTAVSSVGPNQTYRDVYRAWLGNGGSGSSVGTGPAVSTGGGCGWDYWDKAIGLASLSHEDGSFTARAKQGGPTFGVEVQTALLAAIVAGDTAYAAAFANSVAGLSKALAIWMLDNGSAALQHNDTDGLYVSEYGGALELQGYADRAAGGVVIGPSIGSTYKYKTWLTGVSKMNGVHLYSLRSTSASFTIDGQFANTAVPSIYILDPTAAATVVLPSLSEVQVYADGYARLLYVKNVSTTYPVTLDGASTETIDGALTLTLQPGQSVLLQGWNGTNPRWHVVASHSPAGFRTYEAVVALTDAQIKALPTTPIDLVLAPGANKRIKVLSATILYSFVDAVYTNINATYSSFQLQYDSGTWASVGIVNDNSTTAPMANVTALFGGSVHDGIVDLPVPYSGLGDGWWSIQPQVDAGWSGSVNTKLQLGFDNNGSGNLTGGHANNDLRVVVRYTIEDAV